MLALNSVTSTDKISVACHDAGATNIIVGWLKRSPDLKVRAHLGGPAIEIWKRAFPSAENYDLDEAIEGSDVLISGTGWASDLEYEARKLSAKKKIPNIAVIDNWVNYRARFVRKGINIHPDEIWVTDRFAVSIASDEFPKIPIRLLPNHYLDSQIESIRTIKRGNIDANSANLLYVLEPIRQIWSKSEGMPGEFQALDYFIKNRRKICELDLNIVLRLHPSDSPDKYSSWVRDQILNVKTSKGNSLEYDIACSDYVVGCQTYALVVALMAGKRVFSSLPPHAPPLLLPYQGIQELRKL